eukprot:2933113-Pyramimonas_sp.AAC.1
MDVANEMIQSSPMNWTTFLVCICEVRQATALGPEFLQAAEGLQQRRDVQFALPGLVEARSTASATASASCVGWPPCCASPR